MFIPEEDVADDDEQVHSNSHINSVYHVEHASVVIE